MKPDTRITIGIALVYFLNGLFNLSGRGGSFAPMVIYDSLLLAALSFTFCFLRPMKAVHALFAVFATCFLLQQLFMLGKIVNLNAEIVLGVFFLSLCAGFYVYPVITNRSHRILFVLPLVFFFMAVLLGYFDVSVYFKLAASCAGALVQVLVLAHPKIVENLSSLVKRFYLLMSIMVFFDLLATIFLKLNQA